MYVRNIVAGAKLLYADVNAQSCATSMHHPNTKPVIPSSPPAPAPALKAKTRKPAFIRSIGFGRRDYEVGYVSSLLASLETTSLCDRNVASVKLQWFA